MGLVDPVRLAILTVSDAASRGDREDTSGPAIRTWAERAGHVVVEHSVVADEQDR
ncbi:MAG: molybdopterin-binding protein, partial [Gemmatimonadota bacterium]